MSRFEFSVETTKGGAFTKGLNLFYGHPDIEIVFEFPEAKNLLVIVAQMVACGQRFKRGCLYNDVLESPFQVTFIEIPGGMRIILPDSDGELSHSKMKEEEFKRQFSAPGIL